MADLANATSQIPLNELDGPRGCQRHEFGELLDFVNFVFRSDQGRRPSMGGDYPHLYNEANCENFRRIRHRGRIVSCVNIYSARIQWGDAVLKIGAVGGVATDPKYRHGGLAGLNLSDALDHMARNGFDLSILWTGLGDYYRKWGWEDAGVMYLFDMSRTTLRYLPHAPSGELLDDPTDDRVLDAVYTLHAAEKRGIVRDRALTALMISDRPDYRVKVLYVDGKPHAYTVYSVRKRLEIEDYGGDPVGVLGLIRVLCGEHGLSGAEMLAPAEEAGVVPHLRNAGFPARIRSQGMFAVLNPANIVKQYGIDDLTIERSHAGDGDLDGWRVTYNGQSHTYRPLDFVKLLFGPERPGGIDHPKLPLPIHYGALDHM